MSRPLRLQRSSSSMEVEPQDASNNENNGLPDINPTFSELQIRRDNRRTSEKFRDHDLPEGFSNGFNSNDSNEDPRRDVTRRDSIDSVGSDGSQLQLLSPAPRASQRTLLAPPDSLMRLLGTIGNPIRPQVPRTQVATEPPRNIASWMTSMMRNIGGPFRGEPITNVPQIANAEQSNPSNTNANIDTQASEQAEQNQLDINPGRFAQGVIILRSIQPGPNGTTIVRLSLIPIDDMLGRHEQHGERNSLGFLAAMFGLLTGATGMPFEERGLDKETLDSLPVVEYSTEGFKNVEEESKKCPICFDHYEDGQDVRYLWCMHRFHKGCIDQWLDKHTNCPICKKDFSELDKGSFE